MKETTKILVNEHKNILKVADALEKECENIKKGKPVDENFFRFVIEFIRNYADKFHHAKEEEILFKQFCKNESELHCNPVEQMLYEHKEGRNFVRGIEIGLEKRNKNQIIQNALGYVHLIREHIFKEDNILYPLTEQVLSKEAQKDMLKKFEKIQKDREKEIKDYLTFVKKIGKDRK